MLMCMSRDSIVGIATGVWTGRYGVLNPDRDESFFSSPEWPHWLWSPPSLLFNGNWGSFPGVKQLGCDFDHWPPSSTEIKNEWSYISVPPICLHCVDRDYICVCMCVCIHTHTHTHTEILNNLNFGLHRSIWNVASGTWMKYIIPLINAVETFTKHVCCLFTCNNIRITP